MGSLGSRPSGSQIVYVPAPSPSPPPPVVPDETGGEDAGEQRVQNLLRRSRGRFGTVQTGFRGLLGLTGGFGSRKTLLGE